MLRPADLSKPTGTGIKRVGQVQSGLGDRLNLLRQNRDELIEAKTQPALRQLGEQEATATRQVKMMGSLGDRRKADIAMSADLGRQQIQQQALSEQLQSEQGVQQLQSEFSVLFNQMASTGFTEALSGLGEEADRFFAQYGLEGKYNELARDAEQYSLNMISRLGEGLANEIGRDDDEGYGSKSDFRLDSGDKYSDIV